MESIVGKILCDRYRVIKQLSKSSFNSVFIAEDLKHPNKLQCQIERLQPHYDSEVLGTRSWHNILQAFVTQGNIIKNISQHPQIPQLLAFFECDREFYLVREFIDGASLEQKLTDSSIDEVEAISWLQEILGVLDFVHQAEIIHLNIQPSSLIRGHNGQKFLTNFSSVKNAVFFDKNLFDTIGNDDFYPPEQREGKSDFSTDIYALGKTIIYALTGRVANCIQAESPQSLTELKDSIDNNIPTAKIKPELADILNKMVGDRSTIRYQSAVEVLEELDFNQPVVTLPPPISSNFTFPVNNSSIRDKSRKVNPRKKRFKSKQKVLWLFLSLPFIVALVIVFIGIERNTYKDFATYNNDNYQFEIKYPKSWSQKDLDDPITGEIVVFSSSLETAADSFLEKVSIAVEYLSSEPITLEEYTRRVFQRIRQAKGSNIEVYQDRKTRVSKYPARRVVYSRQENGLQLRQMETFTFKDDRVFIAIYTAERAKFSKFLNKASKMVNSWEIE
ncbi:MAG: protein kinase [Pleurocapsa sp.]